MGRHYPHPKWLASAQQAGLVTTCECGIVMCAGEDHVCSRRRREALDKNRRLGLDTSPAAQVLLSKWFRDRAARMRANGHRPG